MARVWNIAAVALIAGAVGMAAQARPGGRIAAGGAHWKQMAPGIHFAPVYGDWDKGAHGKFVRIDHGAEVPMHGHSNGYDAVLTSGRMANVYGDGQRAELVPGDYFHMPAKSAHSHECLSEGGCTFYTHSGGNWDMLGVDENQKGMLYPGFHVIIPTPTDSGENFGSGNTGNSNLGSGVISGKFVRDDAASVPQAEASTHMKPPSTEIGEAGRDHIIIRTDAASSGLQGNARAFEGNILHQTEEVAPVRRVSHPPDEAIGSNKNIIDGNKVPSDDGGNLDSSEHGSSAQDE